MTRKTDDATTPAPDLSWKSATAALTAVAARDAGRGARGIYSRWKADPAGHAVTALTTVLILAVMVLAQSARASVPASADIGPPALTRAAEMRATAVAVDTPEPTPGAQTGEVPAWGAGLPAGVTRWAAEIDAAAERHDVPARLVACMMTIESGGDTDIVSPASAHGLMQVVKDPWHPDYDIQRAEREPAYAVDYGVKFLASLIRDNAGDIRRAVCMYNGGGNCAALAESQRYMAFVMPCYERGA